MNWYKKAQQEEFKFEQKPERKPYYLVVIRRGQETRFKNKSTWAYSPEQARAIFLKQIPQLKDYYQLGYEVEVRLDKEEIRKRQEQARSNEAIKQQDEERIKNSWWNQ